jgi:branched-chain amino acid transport system substrate-binding protein
VRALAERRGMPLLVAAAAPPGDAATGSGWVFRTAPTADDFARLYADFLARLKAAGTPMDRIALVFENTGYGTATAAALRDRLKAAEFDIAAEIGFAPNAGDLAVPVGQLRDVHPAVAILIANAADAALLVKTMKTLDYRPPIAIGDDFGFSDGLFVAAAGYLAQGLIDRGAWNAGKPGSTTAIVNDLYKARAGRDLDDAGARILQGFFVLADAIDRAGSTEPAAIRQALRQTDLKPAQLVTGDQGVRFDASGRNTLASAYLLQLQGKGYATIWPDAAATAALQLPYRGWR